jgi:hypothetical protein
MANQRVLIGGMFVATAATFYWWWRRTYDGANVLRKKSAIKQATITLTDTRVFISDVPIGELAG